MSADPLSGARTKLQRAEEHFSQFAQEWASFLERNPYRMLREADPGQGDGHFLWRAKVVEDPPHETWASLAGECAHALRSALDHTAYAVVNAKKLVSEKAKFPLLDHPSKWKSTHPSDLPKVAPEVLAEVKRLQPYHGGKPNDSLGIINTLDIIDKHRRLSLVNATVEGTFWHATHGKLTTSDPGIGPFKDGAVVGRFKFVLDPPDPRMHMQTHFEFGVALAKGEPGEGRPLGMLLEDLRADVGGVVALFERFL